MADLVARALGNRKDVVITGSELQENPLSDANGQMAISIAEPWELRMARLGLIKNLYSPSAGVACTQGSFTTIYTSLASPEQRAGYNVIPLLIIFSATGSGFAQFEFAREAGGTVQYIQRYIPAAGVWEYKPEGLIVTGNLANFSMKFKADEASKVAWFNMNYAEVSI